MTATTPRAAGVPASTSIPTFFRILLRGQLTKGRLASLGVLGLLGIVLAIVARTFEGDTEQASVDLLAEFGFSVVVPLTSLLIASPMLGNLVEDRLLVYLWLKPVPRWHLAVASLAAVVTALIPFVVVPITIMAVIGGNGALILPCLIAAVLGVLAYCSLYLLFGARFSWGLWLGLLYIVLWENVLSRFSDGMSRLSIRSYLYSILDWGTDRTIEQADRSSVAAIVVPILVAVVATALTGYVLHKRDID